MSIRVIVSDCMRTSEGDISRPIQLLIIGLVRISRVRILLHLHAVRNDSIMRDHDGLRLARRPAREEEQGELRLALSRLELRLRPALRLRETLLDEVVDGEVVVAPHAVEEDDAVVADAGFASGLETDLEGVRADEEDCRLRCLDLVHELVGGVGRVRAATSWKCLDTCS